jgi:hypothetical protein
VPRPRRSTRGLSLPELLTSLAIVSLVCGLSASAASVFSGILSLRSATREVSSLFRMARSRAVFGGTYVGVKWTHGPGGAVSITVHEDGDGDGIRNDDIASGVDRRVHGPIPLKRRWPRVSVAFLPGFAVRDPSGGAVGDLEDPVRFGRSDIASFSPRGDSSPGSVWIGDDRGRQALVRLSGANGRIAVYEWAAARRTWVRVR